MLSRVSYAIACAAAALVNRLPLNHVTRVATGARPVYRKHRRWYAPYLIGGARLGGGRFITLSGTAWHTWERAVYRQVYGETVALDRDGALLIPARPGVPLARLLGATPDGPVAAEACAAALEALAALHQRVIALPDGTMRAFSHGDATVANVTYDPVSGQAWWFDFETAAPARYPHHWRRADDLRAMLYSAAAYIGPARASALARLVAARYAGSPVLDALREMVAHVRRAPDILHLAQARLTYDDAQMLSAALLEIFAPGAYPLSEPASNPRIK